MKKTIAVIMILLLCTSIIIACATVNSSTAAKNYDAPFSDVKDTDWFYEDVKYVYQNNLMNGISNTEFSPSGVTTRGMIVTILWRLEGEPIEKGKDFDDVNNDAYYYNAVAWASNNQIVNGYRESTFGPNDTATREQLVTIMYRYASYKKYDISKEAELDKYVDANQISEYAIKSIKWANANGIISGTSNQTISPKDNVQRCQVAAILKRFCVNTAGIKDEISSEEQPEKDVEEEIVQPGNNKGDEEFTSQETNTSPIIVADKVHAKPGDEVEFVVEVKNNPGILGMTLTLYYDDTFCTLESAENGDAVKNILDLTTSKELGNGSRFVWDGVEITGKDIKDGPVLLLKFKVKDDAPEGTCPITVKYFNDDIVDNNLDAVYPVIKNGEIVISK